MSGVSAYCSWISVPPVNSIPRSMPRTVRMPVAATTMITDSVSQTLRRPMKSKLGFLRI